MLAQRYPEAYDGIAAAAPAFNWNQFIPAAAWAQVMMSIMRQFPTKCELDSLTEAAVASCDALDGVTDGLISDVDKCSFNPFTMIGSVRNCTSTGKSVTITEAAAVIANATWEGPRGPNGEFLWYGVDYQSRLTGSPNPTGTTSDLGYAATTCNTNGTCTGAPTGLGEAWLQLFVKKDPQWNYTLINSVEEYTRLFRSAMQQYDSIIGSADLDLSNYRKAGGKIITYHGLADGLIPHKGTTDYYDRVTKLDPNVDDFFRYFQVAGLAHCSGGSGGQPTSTFQALVDWVEKGTAPDTIPINFNDKSGTQYDRFLCPYPM
ncbi:hypothetical protein AA0114_g12828 [Alternaria tenuissima]|uniref:Carboxylic ester hydrolase n=1 Tax=Alternaria tenuissima TaxID=119927 RepID=A0A4Q4LXW2_9PLEO|nr:hypothetical protein AA0114_g12828 [Alternaria tenuissima]